MSNELAKAKKKLVAIRRAERRLQNRLNDIDWEYDVLLPEVEQMAIDASTQGELIEFILEDDES